MKATSLIVAALALAAVTTAGPARCAEPETGVLVGTVSDGETPLSTAVVFAYEVARQQVRQAVTDGQGNFLFDGLPAGLYKIVAFKSGFLPAVVLLSRANERANQYLEVDLNARTVEREREADDYWSIRERIPGDVLRDIELAAAEGVGEPPPPVETAGFEAQMQALTGVREDAGLGERQLTGGRVDLEGRYQDLEVAFSGDFVTLDPGGSFARRAAAASPARARLLSLDLETAEESRLSLTNLANSMPARAARSLDSADVEQFGVAWSQAIGRSGRSGVAARYLEESNYYRNGLIKPRQVPSASRLWHVEGSYEAALGERSTVNAGVLYREREAESVVGETELPEQRVDLFGSYGLQLRPTVLMEYGLWSTLRDGALSLAPRGEMVLHLGPAWRAQVGGSHRIDSGDERLADFFVTFFDDIDDCDRLEEYCYQVLLTRSWGDGHELSLGAKHRRFAETVRVYFSLDTFDQLESLYLVPGDRLPELSFAFSHRLTPGIHARWETQLAAGGGGVVRGLEQRAYENSVRYLVTSLNTRFDATSTGVLVAVHRLEQDLEPLSPRLRRSPQVERERLQVMLEQDLDFLHRVASKLALQLNMELSRGTTPANTKISDDEILKRVMGGIALKF